MVKKILGNSYLNKVINFVKSHKKLSLIILIVIIALSYFLFPKNKVVIPTDTARIGTIVKSISITGNIESQSTVNLTFQTGGAVVYLGAKEGDNVKKGEAIVSLDRQKLDANFRQALQDFTAAKAASDQYYSGHKNATESYDERVLRTSLDATQNKAYDQMVKAQKDLTDSTLYSPIDGILTRSDAKNIGVNITPATVFTIVDPSSLDFKMDVDEADIGSVKTGQPVEISLDSYPNDTLKLKISSIDFVTHTTSTGGNAYGVKANLINDNNTYKYRVGMNGNAEIILEKKENVLYIPISSIFDNDKVYVKTKLGFEKRQIKVGLENDTLAQIKGGLKSGEIVALDPSLVLQNKNTIPIVGKSN